MTNTMNLPTGIASDGTDADLIRIFSMAGMLRQAGYTVQLTSTLDKTELWTNAPAFTVDGLIHLLHR